MNVLDENDYLFLAMNEMHYLTVYMEKIREIGCQFTSINIAKEYRK
ncbi:MAG: hypothetical protein IJ274_10650 [Lachnospiraceae bacterium]|nr:hypothetical protein [Lachnospiraceae bacterium]